MSKLGYKNTLSAEEWRFLQSYERVFAVVTEATSLTEGDDYPSASMYIALVVALETELEKEVESEELSDRQLALQLKSAIGERFSNSFHNESLIIATMLDPRFKEEIFPEQFRDECRSVVKAKMQEYTTPADQPSTITTPTSTSKLFQLPWFYFFKFL